MIFYGRDYEKSLHYSRLAYQLANENKTRIKLWQYLEIITKLAINYQAIEGENSTKAKGVINEYNELVFKLDKTSSQFTYHFGDFLREQITYGVGKYEEILGKYKMRLEPDLKNNSYAMVSIYRANSEYLGILGEFKKAEITIEYALELISNEQGENNTYFVYFLDQLIKLKLQQGNSEEALNLTEQKVIPITKKYDPLQWLGMYQASYCELLSQIENSSRIKKLCFDGFDNTVAGVGLDSEWIDTALSGVISWYALEQPDTKESYYLDILEKRFDKLAAGKKVRIGFIIEKYFITRRNFDKASHYHHVVARTMDEYYGKVDAINRYYHQVMAAEIALLKNDSATAKQHLSEVKVKLCGLGEQNPHRIKYVKLTKSLSMSTCGAI